jgi:hypothetical protein
MSSPACVSSSGSRKNAIRIGNGLASRSKISPILHQPASLHDRSARQAPAALQLRSSAFIGGSTGPGGAAPSALPENLTRDFIDGMQQFDRTIRGFAGDQCWVIGLESRTSSPVRILRGEDFESAVRGLYPCGEGAGYAGGIMSAAMDGIRVAEAIRKKYSEEGNQ